MNPQGKQLRQLAGALWVLFFLVAVTSLYWGVWRREELAVRDDNPRVVEAALRIQRGTIFDVQNVILAETIGPSDRTERSYPLADIGPAVGYYSFRHGAAGIESGMAAVLEGSDESELDRLWRQALHLPQVGRDVRLTLDSEWQLLAEALLGDQRGAVLLLSVPDGAVRVMVSHPGFDPNELDAAFEDLAVDAEAPLLNRSTQGLYQPGLVLQPLLYAAAVEQRRIINLANALPHMSDPVELSDQVLTCEGDPAGDESWTMSLQARCPAPLLTLASSWRPEELVAILDGFGLTTPPDLPLATESAGPLTITDMERSLLGQGELTVSPLQMALAFGALANEGRLLRPQLVASIMDENGAWQLATENFQPGLTAVSALAAQEVLTALPRQEGIIEHHVLTLAGPAESENGWYLALAPAGAPQLVAVVVVEDVQNEALAQEIGRALLREILFGGRP
ncbi:MAG: hypothetical protein KDE28_27070 [Anaerolineales bacterium]|nr:hypothetical protein [Anaerolineales bacterium]